MIRRFTYLIGVLFVFQLYIYADDTLKKDYLKFGGAVRFNTIIQNYEKSEKALDESVKFDAFIISADAHQMGFDVSLQYRFYPESKTHFFRHAYIGYEIDQKWYAKLGIIQKPFGIGDYASHNWFFQLPYYLGLEDRHAMGIGTTFNHEKWTVDLAYFRQASPGGPIKGEDNAVGNGRYSYAIVPTTGIVNGEVVDANVRELDQFNTRVRYQLTDQVELGGSAQLGGIYNRELDKRQWGINWAGHIVYDFDRWNFKGEVIGYNYNAKANNGERLDAVQMAAYGSAYDVASKGIIYVAGLSYKIPVNRKFFQSITPYFDYSYLDKDKHGYNATHHMIPGLMFQSGPISTYVEYAMGKNQPWFTSNFGEGLAEGSKNARWNGRFNINIGYYF